MSKHYEYDLEKANWLMQQGCVATGTGVSIRGSRYIVFKVTKKMKQASLYYDNI